MIWQVKSLPITKNDRQKPAARLVVAIVAQTLLPGSGNHANPRHHRQVRGAPDGAAADR